MKKLLIALLSLSLLSAIGCNDDQGKECDSVCQAQKKKDEQKKEIQTFSSDPQTKAVVEEAAKNYADIGFAAYSDAVDGAKKLKTAIDDFVKEAQKVPVNNGELQRKLEVAKTAWKNSRPAYLQTEVYRFYQGPINQNNPEYDNDGEIEPMVNAWPIDESFIDFTCLYAGRPDENDPKRPKKSPDDYHCDPAHMVSIALGGKTECSELDPSAVTGTETTDAKKEILKNAQKIGTDCWIPGVDSGSQRYAAVNMVTYHSSVIGRSQWTGEDPFAKDYSSLSPDEKKKVQKALREVDLIKEGDEAGNRRKLDGQGYGDGEDLDKNQECQEGSPNCHHLPQGEANVSTGYHAIEFLLWGQDFNPKGPGNRALTDFTTEPNAKKRLIYLQAAVDMLIVDLQWVADQWKDGVPDNYRDKFLKEDPYEQYSKMFAGMYQLSVNETGGERIKPALRMESQEEEHSCFSDNTHVDMQEDIQGIVNVYNGVYKKVDGTTVGTQDKGMGAVLSKLQDLCKKDVFQGEDYCKDTSKPDSAKLGQSLNKALGDAKNLLISGTDGAESFDQEVWKHWPPTSQTENPGRKKLETLDQDLSDLDPLYAPFSSLLGVDLSALEGE